MTWDYAEGNPFSNSTGSFNNMLDWVVKSVRELPATQVDDARQHDVLKHFPINNVMISTDPPYYDNISYADLSDFFYIWMRRPLKLIYPQLLLKMTTPKQSELISAPYRQGGKDSARKFFEDGMRVALKNIYAAATTEYPVTIYYAYKQSNDDADKNPISAGWETMLTAIIDAGFIITGTLPVRTELTNRMRGINSNALSTSIVIVCRKPVAPKPSCMYGEFLARLKSELKTRLTELQKANLSPVDMSQAAIGPGMEIYSRYSAIMRGDGTVPDVRSALLLINRELDDFLGSQDSDLDAESKFCIELYKQSEFDEIKFGSAQLLATAKNVSMIRLKERGIIESSRGLVRLLRREELKDDISDCVWVLTQRAVQWVQEEGADFYAKILLEHESRKELIKRLAYRLYNIADRRKHTDEANGYSRLVDVWGLIEKALAKLKEKGNRGQTELELKSK